MTNHCRYCGCTDARACPQGTDFETGGPLEGCAWVDANQTLCSAFVEVDAAWKRLPTALLAGVRGPTLRAFFRGFMAGWCDERGVDHQNPYRDGKGQRSMYWEHGYAAGAQALAAPFGRAAAGDLWTP